MRRALSMIVVTLSLTPAFARTAVTFEERAVVARVTPGASTAWFSIEHTRNGYRLRIVDRAVILADDDRDGVVRLAVEQLSERSVWMVVDLATGDYAIEAPASIAPARRRPLPSAALRAREDGRAAHVIHDMTSSVLWLVRPGVGAWAATVEDGSAEDGDGSTNGVVAAAIGKMVPIGGSPPAPDDLRRDDVLVIAEPVALHVFDARVVK